jgi:DNA-binding response OmpR family regulator
MSIEGMHPFMSIFYTHIQNEKEVVENEALYKELWSSFPKHSSNSSFRRSYLHTLRISLQAEDTGCPR